LQFVLVLFKKYILLEYGVLCLDMVQYGKAAWHCILERVVMCIKLESKLLLSIIITSCLSAISTVVQAKLSSKLMCYVSISTSFDKCALYC